MDRIYDVYASFWNKKWGMDFNSLSKINSEEIWFKAKLLKLRMNARLAREKYKNISYNVSFKDTEKKRLLDSIMVFSVNTLPKYSVYIKITFRLRRPYLSRDEDSFYVIDNPIAKDKVFKIPMVRPTTWRGVLRYAAIKVFEEWILKELKNSNRINRDEVFRERAKLIKLFGSEKDSQKEYLGKLCLIAIEGRNTKIDKKAVEEINREFDEWLIRKRLITKKVPVRAGRLFFFPTFFDRLSLDVITPLKRDTKTPARGPIYFEVVPEGSEGVFRLLYYPFDLVAKGEFENIENEMKGDLKLLEKALNKMFFEIGFSAKKTSGFGILSSFKGKIWCPFRKKEEKKFLSFNKIVSEIFT